MILNIELSQSHQSENLLVAFPATTKAHRQCGVRDTRCALLFVCFVGVCLKGQRTRGGRIDLGL